MAFFKNTFFYIGIFYFLFFSTRGWTNDALTAKKVEADLTKLEINGSFWKNSSEKTIILHAQPMIAPRPKITSTPSLQAKAVHNGEWISFLLKWKDQEMSDASKLGKFSDAVAIQFPVKEEESPPPIFMGSKESPVHILHWRAQYQKDKEKGFQSMKDMYPNMSVDIYPLEFAEEFTSDKMLEKISQEQREVFVPGRAAGNPQSFQKIKGIDEIFAEGFGSSSVIENARALALGEWKKGEWKIMITRPLVLEKGSTLKAGQKSFVAFAVWQGGKNEVGSRKSVTMMWTPLIVEKTP